MRGHIRCDAMQCDAMRCDARCAGPARRRQVLRVLRGCRRCAPGLRAPPQPMGSWARTRRSMCTLRPRAALLRLLLFLLWRRRRQGQRHTARHRPRCVAAAGFGRGLRRALPEPSQQPAARGTQPAAKAGQRAAVRTASCRSIFICRPHRQPTKARAQRGARSVFPHRGPARLGAPASQQARSRTVALPAPARRPAAAGASLPGELNASPARQPVAHRPLSALHPLTPRARRRAAGRCASTGGRVACAEPMHATIRCWRGPGSSGLN